MVNGAGNNSYVWVIWLAKRYMLPGIAVLVFEETVSLSRKFNLMN